VQSRVPTEPSLMIFDIIHRTASSRYIQLSAISFFGSCGRDELLVAGYGRGSGISAGFSVPLPRGAPQNTLQLHHPPAFINTFSYYLLSMSVPPPTSTWDTIQNVFYRKHEIYQMSWKVPDLSDYLVTAAKNGGPIGERTSDNLSQC